MRKDYKCKLTLVECLIGLAWLAAVLLLCMAKNFPSRPEHLNELFPIRLYPLPPAQEEEEEQVYSSRVCLV
jgi:hypothetical protein